ncbi:putative aspartic peptidase A1 family, aspartic peptidase domain superfamily [Helianthus anomalus]
MTDYVNMQFLHANFLIDIDAPFIWHDCIVQWNIRPGSCPPNKLLRASYGYKNPSCAPETNSLTLPGWGFCTCSVNVVNPMTGSCDQALLNFDGLTVTAIDERNKFNGHLGSYPFAA